MSTSHDFVWMWLHNNTLNSIMVWLLPGPERFVLNRLMDWDHVMKCTDKISTQTSESVSRHVSSNSSARGIVFMSLRWMTQDLMDETLFGKWLGFLRQRVITSTNNNQVIRCHICHHRKPMSNVFDWNPVRCTCAADNWYLRYQLL